MLTWPGRCCQQTAVVAFNATLCNASCHPDSSNPVTITITQTSGGTYTATQTQNSSSAVSFTLPYPSSGSYTFSVQWSCPSFTTDTTTYTLTAGTTPTSPVGHSLHTPSSHFCYPGASCFDSIPTSVSVTISSETPVAGPLGQCCPTQSMCLGTYTVALSSVSADHQTIIYQSLGIVTTCVDGLGTHFNINITVTISANAGCSPSATVSIGYSDCATGDTGVTCSLTSGTAACPISFTAQGTSQDSAFPTPNQRCVFVVTVS